MVTALVILVVALATLWVVRDVALRVIDERNASSALRAEFDKLQDSLAKEVVDLSGRIASVEGVQLASRNKLAELTSFLNSSKRSR